MGFHHVGQAGLELPISGDPPTLASKVLGLQAWATTPGQKWKILILSWGILAFQVFEEIETLLN